MSSSGIKKAETEEDPKVACGAFVDNAPSPPLPFLKLSRGATLFRGEQRAAIHGWLAHLLLSIRPCVRAGSRPRPWVGALPTRVP